MATVRRAKWQPPPPPTPRILHLPRRSSRRKQPIRNAAVKSNSGDNPFLRRSQKGKLESLLDKERAFSSNIPPAVLLNSGERGRGERVEEEEEEGGFEEKWRFQAEMLRAECNLLRMEREIALKKLERQRGLLEQSLKSAVQTLISGKKQIREGKSVNSVMEEEIEELAKKLVELQRSANLKDPKLKNCSNFDKQASLLQKQLEKLSEVPDDVKDIKEISEAGSSSDRARDFRLSGFVSDGRSSRLADVEILRRKMEELSKGKLLKKVEEVYGSMSSATFNNSVPSSALSSRRYDDLDSSANSFRQCSQEANSDELKTCSGQCKAIVRRIMEQVKAETEQWSQMQRMLGQVRGEMEELRTSQDFWEEQALQSDYKIQTLSSEVEEWKDKALSLESKESQLQKHVQELQQELEKLRLGKNCDSEVKASRDSVPLSLGAQLAKEKRLLRCHIKGSILTGENLDKEVVKCSDENKTLYKSGSRFVPLNRNPFKDIGNLQPLTRQNSRRYVYPLHGPQHS